jgi:glycosyltransferase involved in cell wall biosynthesis
MHRLTALAWRRPLPTIQSTGQPPVRRPAAPAAASGQTQPVVACALATGDLDVGGIGPVIEMLALGFAEFGIRPMVICLGDGIRAARLRAAGIEVRSLSGPDDARAALRDVDVLALHSAPEYLEDAALQTRLPLVVAMHNTEIHFTRRRWRAFAGIAERSAAGVAVSETVRTFHARHLPDGIADRFVVIPNGAQVPPPIGPERRESARAALAAAIGTRLAPTDVVFVCLARYDSQKNVAGTVASFLYAVENGLRGAHLVYAGAPSDWVEYLRADGIRRSSAFADHVHLMGNSDPATLLAAGDAFLLNSFFEGWPVAATEAAAAGLPLVLSDVGGAAELVSASGTGSVLVPNATGAASEVSDARVRAARRRANRQPNRDDLRAALVAVAERRRRESARVVPAGLEDSVANMVAQHAAVIRRTAGVGSERREVPAS